MEFTTRFIFALPHFSSRISLSLVILKPSDKDGFRISAPNAADPVTPKATSPLTTVLRVVVPEPRLRCLLALIQRHPFRRSQPPQPGKILPPGASLVKLLLESLTFQTA
jgi:hypothetical protein